LGKRCIGKNMSIAGKMMVLSVGGVALAAAVQATAALAAEDAPGGNASYSEIASRNIFALHDGADDPHDVKPQTPRPNIKLTGIMTIGGSKKALLIVNSPETTGKASAVHSLILGEGQRGDGLEILEINPQARTVKIKSDKIELPLDFCLAETGK
jgi:hypothetical protein